MGNEIGPMANELLSASQNDTVYKSNKLLANSNDGEDSANFRKMLTT